MLKKFNFLLLLPALLAAAPLLAHDASGSSDHPDSKDCALAKFFQLSKDMEAKGVSNPKEYAPIQDQFLRCKWHLMDDLDAAVSSISQKRMEFTTRLMSELRSSEDGYLALVECVSLLMEFLAGSELEECLSSTEKSAELYKKAVDYLLEPLEGTMMEQVGIYEIVFGKMDDQETAEDFAKSLHGKTNVQTLKWIPYAMLMRNLKEGQFVLSEDTLRYLDHRVERKSYEKSKFKWLWKCFGAEPPKKFVLSE